MVASIFDHEYHKWSLQKLFQIQVLKTYKVLQKKLWKSPITTNEHKGKVGTFRSDGQNGNVNVVKEFPQTLFINNYEFFSRTNW